MSVVLDGVVYYRESEYNAILSELLQRREEVAELMRECERLRKVVAEMREEENLVEECWKMIHEWMKTPPVGSRENDERLFARNLVRFFKERLAQSG